MKQYNHNTQILFLTIVIAAVIQAGCIPESTGNNKPRQWTYETAPHPKAYFCQKDDCSALITDMILSSKDVKCAFFDLDLKDLIKILKSKNASLVIDKSNRIPERIGKGMDVVYNDYRKQLMHNKFCILDKKTVITGSMNPTENGAYKNDNNIVVFESYHIAKNYLDEFNELRHETFGSGSKVRYPKINLTGTLVENYFCPEDECKKHVSDILRSAKESINFMLFSFTDKGIADILISKAGSINVSGIMEKRRINIKHNLFNYLDMSKVDVKTDNNPAIMHHKVFIIDKEIVITGSYNPTISGDSKNDENIVIIKDKKIAEMFLKEFRMVRYG